MDTRAYLVVSLLTIHLMSFPGARPKSVLRGRHKGSVRRLGKNIVKVRIIRQSRLTDKTSLLLKEGLSYDWDVTMVLTIFGQGLI